MLYVSTKKFLPNKIENLHTTKSLKSSSGIQCQDDNRRFFNCCKLHGGVSAQQTCLSNTSHKCSMGFKFEEFGSKHNTAKTFFMFLKQFLYKQFRSTYCSSERQLLQDLFHEVVYLIFNDIHMNDTQQNTMNHRTQCFSEEHFAHIIQSVFTSSFLFIQCITMSQYHGVCLFQNKERHFRIGDILALIQAMVPMLLCHLKIFQ